MPNMTQPMTRDAAVEHIISALSDTITLMIREHLMTEAEAAGYQQRDYDALVSLGVSPEEITEAQQRL
jgi:Holliday junction resolvasome RuvABC DNA-binding subunit